MVAESNRPHEPFPDVIDAGHPFVSYSFRFTVQMGLLRQKRLVGWMLSKFTARLPIKGIHRIP